MTCTESCVRSICWATGRITHCGRWIVEGLCGELCVSSCSKSSLGQLVFGCLTVSSVYGCIWILFGGVEVATVLRSYRCNGPKQAHFVLQDMRPIYEKWSVCAPNHFRREAGRKYDHSSCHTRKIYCALDFLHLKRKPNLYFNCLASKLEYVKLPDHPHLLSSDFKWTHMRCTPHGERESLENILCSTLVLNESMFGCWK